MKILKNTCISFSLLFAATSTSYAQVNAAGGIPVTDGNTWQMVLQAVEQVKNQVKQIEELQAQVTALTSVEGLKNAAKDVTLNNIPTEWKDIYKDIDGLTQSDVDSILSLKNYDSTSGQKALANQVLHLEKAFQETTQRLTRLNGLQDRLRTATNVKEAADIQNQIATESAAITVAQTQLDNMHRTYEIQKEVYAEQQILNNYCANAAFFPNWNTQGKCN